MTFKAVFAFPHGGDEYHNFRNLIEVDDWTTHNRVKPHEKVILVAEIRQSFSYEDLVLNMARFDLPRGLVNHPRENLFVLFLDWCEGYSYNAGYFPTFNIFHAFASRNNIDLSHIGYGSGNLLDFEQYDKFADGLPGKIKIYSIPFLMDFWKYDHGRDYSLIKKVFPFKRNHKHDKKKYLGLCLNKRHTYQRFIMVYQLWHSGLLNKCLVSFSRKIPERNLTEENNYHSLFDRFSTHTHSQDHDLFKQFYSILPLELQKGYDFEDNDWDNSYNYDWYRSSFVDIVNETGVNDNYDENESVFFSEKIFRSMALGAPFIINGGVRYCEKLKELGFKTFDSVWDENYDTIKCHDERTLAIIDLLKDIDKRRHDVDFFNKVYSIAEFNYNKYHKTFIGDLFKEFRADIKNTLG